MLEFSKRPSNSGFTLIELIVVMSIVAISYSLVGPNLFKSLDKTNFYAEKKGTQELFKTLGNRAFINSQPVEVVLSGKTITYGYQHKEERKKLQYSYIEFPRQKVVFSASGFPDSKYITVNYQDKFTKVALDDYVQ